MAPAYTGSRTDQIGSLLRPPRLKQAYIANLKGELADSALEMIEHEEIRDVVARQCQLGIGVVTDGEYRRETFSEVVRNSVSGMGDVREAWKRTMLHELEDVRNIPPRVDVTFPGTAGVTARVQLVRNQVLDEFKFVAKLSSTPVKVTMPQVGAQGISADKLKPFYNSGTSSWMIFASPLAR